MSRIVVVQPYVPVYRKPFFDAVVAELARHGHQCLVATGRLNTTRAARGDSVTGSWHVERKGFSFKLRGRHFRSYSSLRSWFKADLVVLELATGAIDTYLALIVPGRRRIALWGHVGARTGKSHPVLEKIETWQLRRAQAIFAYTESGRRRAVERGADALHTQSLNNTVDLQPLIDELHDRASGHEAVRAPDPTRPKGKTFAYIGGLDASKRIDFLAEVLDLVWQADPEIRLLVGGAGGQAGLLDKSVARGQTTLLGRIGNQGKADLSEACTALLIPGRVGLVAAESFVLGLPIVTTDWPYHAPEFEYLQPGHDCVVTENNAEAYAREILRLASDPDDVKRLRSNALSRAGWPSMDDMVANFVRGCLALVSPNPVV